MKKLTIYFELPFETPYAQYGEHFENPRGFFKTFDDVFEKLDKSTWGKFKMGQKVLAQKERGVSSPSKALAITVEIRIYTKRPNIRSVWMDLQLIAARKPFFLPIYCNVY